MNKVLVIAHRFPPVASSGSFRPAKFVKYLPQFNWQPYVISTIRSIRDSIDESLLKDIPDSIQVWRKPTPHPRPLDRFYGMWRGFFGRSEQEDHGQRDKTGYKLSGIGKFFHLLKTLLLAPLSFIQYPPLDDEIYWSLRILPEAYRIIKKEKIDLIFTTSDPWSSLLVGLILKALTRRPWVADMRDPWTTEKLRYSNRGWRRLIDLRVERLCLGRADAVIGVTPNWLADLRRIAGDGESQDRFFLITNGYDLDDFPFQENPPLNSISTITICHIGSMFEGALVPLVEGLEKLDLITRSKLCFDLVGYVHPKDLALLEGSPVKDCFHHQPARISHEEALQRMRSSHALLLTLPFEYYPGKLFEYLQVKRPVLALVDPGSTADLIEWTGVGRLVHRREVDELVRALEEIAQDYQQFVRNHYNPNWERIARFDRKMLTEDLVRVFQMALANGK